MVTLYNSEVVFGYNIICYTIVEHIFKPGYSGGREVLHFIVCYFSSYLFEKSHNHSGLKHFVFGRNVLNSTLEIIKILAFGDKISLKKIGCL